MVKKSKRTLYSQYKNAQVKNIHDDGGVMYSNILTIFDIDLRFILIFSPKLTCNNNLSTFYFDTQQQQPQHTSLFKFVVVFHSIM